MYVGGIWGDSGANYGQNRARPSLPRLSASQCSYCTWPFGCEVSNFLSPTKSVTDVILQYYIAFSFLEVEKEKC